MQCIHRFVSCCVSLASVLLLAGCTGKMVTVVDGAAFDTMALHTAPLMQERQILDSGGAYLTTLVSFFDTVPRDAGERLFMRLSPAFRFRGTDPAMLPETSASSAAANERVRFTPTSFTLEQGLQRITVELVGLADWTGTEAQSWFVRCTVAVKKYNEERTYYLVVVDPEASMYAPQLLGIYDCRSGQCRIYLETGLSQQAAMPSEEGVIDVLPGEFEITAPPVE